TVPNAAFTYEGKVYVLNSTAPDSLVSVIDPNGPSVETITLTGVAAAWDLFIENDLMYVTGNLSNDLTIYDLNAETAETVALPEKCVPANFAKTGDKVYVACTGYDSNTFGYASPGKLAVVDLSGSKASVGAIELSQINPGSVALGPNEDYLYVVETGDYGEATGKVDMIDLSDDTIDDTVEVGSAPGPIAIDGNGLAYVGDNFSGSVWVFDTQDNNAWVKGTDDPLTIEGAFWVADLWYFAAEGTVWASDWTNARTVAFDPNHEFAAEFIASPNAGGYTPAP
ncbi:hypothetical protein KDL45_14845, partial [bacterium]|nr:hypothetical protein [bacterium]